MPDDHKPVFLGGYRTASITLTNGGESPPSTVASLAENSRPAAGPLQNFAIVICTVMDGAGNANLRVAATLTQLFVRKECLYVVDIDAVVLRPRRTLLQHGGSYLRSLGGRGGGLG